MHPKSCRPSCSPSRIGSQGFARARAQPAAASGSDSARRLKKVQDSSQTIVGVPLCRSPRERAGGRSAAASGRVGTHRDRSAARMPSCVRAGASGASGKCRGVVSGSFCRRPTLESLPSGSKSYRGWAKIGATSVDGFRDAHVEGTEQALHLEQGH